MSSKEPLKGRFLLDADAFLSYIGGGELVDHAEKIIKLIADGMIEAYVSSMLYDDIISALCSKGMNLNSVIQVLVAIASILHKPLLITPETAISALTLYIKHGGPGKLHYFDAFHVAIARQHGLPMITSDNYINAHQQDLGITVYNLKRI